MKLNSKIIPLVLCVFLLNVLSGCAGQTDQAQETEDKAPAETAIILTDHMGREVKIPDKPQRILALNPFMMENLFVLGVTPVGKIDDYTYREEGVALPSVGMQKNVNLEAIYELNPDLIFAQVTFHGDMLESLEATGACVFYIDSKETEGAAFGVLEAMGEVLDKQETVVAYIKKIEALSAEIQEKTSGSELKTAIILLGGTDSVYAFHPNSFPADIVTKVGLKNVVSPDLPLVSKESSGVGSAVSYDIETIILQDPDVILIRSGSVKGDGSKAAKGEDAQKILEKYYKDPLYKDLRAVKNGNVYLLPGTINPGTISIEEAMQITAEIIYPEIFKQ